MRRLYRHNSPHSAVRPIITVLLIAIAVIGSGLSLTWYIDHHVTQIADSQQQGKIPLPREGQPLDGSDLTIAPAQRIHSLPVIPGTPSTPPPTTPPNPSTPPPTPPAPTLACTVDASEAPQLTSLKRTIEATCAKTLPLIVKLLNTNFPYDKPVTVTIKNHPQYDYIAYAQGNSITLQTGYLRTHPDDMGMIVHELTHVVEAYRQGSPNWITEGIADYARYKLDYDNSWSHFGCASKDRYTSGYSCAATFLRYVQNHYDYAIVQKVHAAVRAGTYDDSLFQRNTGKTIHQLYAACRTADCKGGQP